MNIGVLSLTEHSDIRAAVCKIGPIEAMELLKRNTHNRKMSQAVVDKYVDEMNSGEWVPTASGIGIDERGVLSDGQQRLAAIAKYGKPVFMTVVSGIPVLAQEKIDRQRKRTLADVFHLAGICKDRKPVMLATFLSRVTTGESHPSDAAVKASFECHRESIMAVYAECKSNEKGVGQVGALSAIVIAHEVHKEKAIAFLKKLRQDLYVRQDDPARVLRRALTGESRTAGVEATGGNRQAWAYKKTLYAFNAFAHDRYITQVRESTEVEQ
jgi:hypothetical protein